MQQERVISFIVSNQPGVLSRVSGVISRRGFNIESLTVGVTSNTALSRITIVMYADDSVIEQVVKQFDKLLDVKAIKEIPADGGIFREIALIKIGTRGAAKKELMKDIEKCKGVVLDIGEESVTVQLTGRIDHINESVAMLKKYYIIELARTGMVALESGDAQLYNSRKAAMQKI
ncbi:MAG: acetolactate synthase small subunit [Christensenellales bacterium]